MESGFSALAQVAGTLFGLLLMSLVFAYSMAVTRIDSIRALHILMLPCDVCEKNVAIHYTCQKSAS